MACPHEGHRPAALQRKEAAVAAQQTHESIARDNFEGQDVEGRNAHGIHYRDQRADDVCPDWIAVLAEQCGLSFSSAEEMVAFAASLG